MEGDRTPNGASARPRDGTRPAPRVRTFLIADIRGYTGFTAQHGDAAASRLAVKFGTVVAEGLEAWDGTLVELRGDEALAVFDSARQALRAAVELQAVFTAETQIEPELPLHVGIGLDAGEAVEVGAGYRGAALNLASRLCAVASAGEVIASQELVHLAGRTSGLSYSQVRHRVKGLPEPVEALRVGAEPPAGRSPPVAPTAGPPAALPPELDPITPLAGRQADLRWLYWHWRRARHGAGRCVVISGQPGMGKTRLAAELAAAVRASGGTVEYVPAARHRGEWTQLEPSRNGWPRLVIVDDFDAAPAGLGQAVVAFSRTLPGRPTLLVVNHRQEAAPELLALVEQLAPGHLRHSLGPLEPDAVRAIAALYAGASADSAPLPEILDKSGGVPAVIHQLASHWARIQLTNRLGSSAQRTATERGGLRAAEAELIDDVAKLEQLSERARLFSGQPGEGAADPGPSLTICPYKGLAAFEAGDAEYYFGRDRLIAELVARLVGSTFLGLLGASGSGKSSALGAGLLPALAAGVLPGSDSWLQVVMRPGERPLAELDRALRRARPGHQVDSVDPQIAFDAALEGLAPGQRLMLVVDQFEELFTTARDDDERARFIDLITSERAGLVVIVALRADHYWRCASYPELARLLADNHVLVGPLTDAELAGVIEHPARRVGLLVEPELVRALVADAGSAPGALPLLSTALLELWRVRDGRRLTLAAYRAGGGLSEAIARLAEDAYGGLDPAQQQVARSVLLRLAGPGEGEGVVRRRVPVAEFSTDRDAAVGSVLESLTAARLITSGDGYVEVAHEALLRDWPRLQSWLEEDVAGRQLRLHLIGAARAWEERGREAGDLYRGARLAATLDWASEHTTELNASERDFLTQSRFAAEREAQRHRRVNRRLRILLAAAAGLLVLAIAAGMFAALQAGIARQAEDFARSRELAASAVAALDDDPALSKLLALAAADMADPPLESISVLHQAWLADRVVFRYEPEARRAEWADLHPSGQLMVASGMVPTSRTDRGHDFVEVVDIENEIVLWSFDPEGQSADKSVAVGMAFFTADGERVVAGVFRDPFADGQPQRGLLGVYTWNARTGEELEQFDVGDCGGIVTAVSETHALVRTFVPPRCLDFDAEQLPPPRSLPDTRLELVDLESGERDVITERAAWVQPPDGALSRSGRYVAFDDRTRPDGLSVVLDLQDRRRVLEINPADVKQHRSYAARLSHDGALLLYGEIPIQIWDVATGEKIAEVGDGLGFLWPEFSPSGEAIYTAGDDGGLRSWDSATGAHLWVIPGIGFGRPSANDEGLVVVPRIETPGAVLVDTRLRGEVGAIDPEAASNLGIGAQHSGCFAATDSLLTTPGGHAIYLYGGDECVTPATRVVDSTTLEFLLAIPGGTGQRVAVAPDGSRIVRQEAEGSLVGRLTIRDLVEGTEAFEMQGLCTYDSSNGRPPTDTPECRALPEQPFGIWAEQLRWSADGGFIAALDQLTRSIVVWSASDGALIRAIPSDAYVSDIVFSPDSRRLVVAYDGGALRALSTDSWEVAAEGHLESSRAFDLGRPSFFGYARDGSTLHALSRGSGGLGAALHWVHQETLEPARPSIDRVHDTEPVSKAMSPDGSLLVVAARDGLVRVWNADTGALVHEIRLGQDQATSVAFVNSKHLAAAARNGDLRVFTIDTAELLDIVRSSLTRGLTDPECRRFNFGEACPTLAQQRAGDSP